VCDRLCYPRPTTTEMPETENVAERESKVIEDQNTVISDPVPHYRVQST